MKAYQTEVFGYLGQQEVKTYRLETDAGISLEVMPYGATLLNYRLPDRQGQLANVVLNFLSLAEYLDNAPRYGASIGPVAGRIYPTKFQLQDQTVQLESNEGQKNLHSGQQGLDRTLFQVQAISDSQVVFVTQRPNGQGGFPGQMDIAVTYQLAEEGTVTISYRIQADRDTLVNPTNHSYFNLSGNCQASIADHYLQLSASGVHFIDDQSLPAWTSQRPDFLKNLQRGCQLQAIFASDHPQIRRVNGLDHPFELDGQASQALRLEDKVSGRCLTVTTDASHLVLYSANVPISPQGPIHNGLAIECQALPNAIHGPHPETVLLPAGQVFERTMIYKPSVLE